MAVDVEYHGGSCEIGIRITMVVVVSNCGKTGGYIGLVLECIRRE